jgi:hypothetical protein
LKVRYLLLAVCLCFETANMVGFSWARLRRLSNEELADVAIRHHYGNVYSNTADLKVDYVSFKPEVHYWADLTGEAGSQLLNKLFGFKFFQVRLPDAVVIVSADGVAQFSRTCGENHWCSPAVAPDRPVLGIVGTVQDGPPNYEVMTEFSARWSEGSDGDAFAAGHCFSALSHSPKPTLRIRSERNSDDVVTIGDMYGYYLITIMDIKRAGYGVLRISEQEFRRSQTCDKSVRAEWPNVGGASWSADWIADATC